MKTFAIVALAITGFTFAPTTASALDHFHDDGFSFKKQNSLHHHHQSFQCAPTYVCTKEIGRSLKCVSGYDHCGHKYVYHVVVVTYANYYSDGSYTTFQKSYRA